jgi:hypothetical protein
MSLRQFKPNENDTHNHFGPHKSSTLHLTDKLATLDPSTMAA